MIMMCMSIKLKLNCTIVKCICSHAELKLLSGTSIKKVARPINLARYIGNCIDFTHEL